MYIIIDYQNRRPRATDPYAFNIEFSEDELISLKIPFKYCTETIGFRV